MLHLRPTPGTKEFYIKLLEKIKGKLRIDGNDDPQKNIKFRED